METFPGETMAAAPRQEASPKARKGAAISAGVSPKWPASDGSPQSALMIETLSPNRKHSTAIGDAAWASPGIASFEPQAVVCVPTFRRPDMLRRTLQSLAGQRSAVSFTVVVVDNDAADRAGAPVAASFFREGLLAGLCFLEERQGNCYAINRAFREARERFPTASYFLMIDDDEIADPFWLDRMVAAARARDADIVGGPVIPEFPPNARPALTKHPIYWPAFTTSGFVPMIYGSGNCLISRRAFERVGNPDFDLRYNYLGGGDADFFTRCREAGLVFYWEQAARIAETVPPERLRPRWIFRRSLQIGAINFRLDRTRSQTLRDHARLIAKNLALLPVSAIRSLNLVPRHKSLLVIGHPMVIAIGRILAAFGGEPEHYRAKRMGPK
jgi:GT2 family glycosyltransferase